ncbi:MAG: CRTAC1 family protein [Planctomycetes bacterium]|nr:CRTAC1 family protein [Planctomycetota bacterium]
MGSRRMVCAQSVRRGIVRALGLGVLGLLDIVEWVSVASAQVVFEDVTATSGLVGYLHPDGSGSGLAAADFDADGDVDLFAPTHWSVPDRLYRNLGNGTFEEVGAQLGLTSNGHHRAALWLDIDGDGDLDLLVVGDCPFLPCGQSLVLYRQESPTSFVDVTADSGLDNATIQSTLPVMGGVAAGDLDGDRDLDLVFCEWNGRVRLFLGQGDGTFVDATLGSGLDPTIRKHWQPVLFDANLDGSLDLYVSVDFGPNQLWINQGNATFTNEAGVAGVNNSMNDMGIAIGDYDNDLDLDLFVTNIFEFGEHNVLYRRTSDVPIQYQEVSATSGVANGYWGWGTTFQDFDHDGWLDLAATNGWWTLPWNDDPSRLWINQGGASPVFSDVSVPSGFADTDVAMGLVALDIDRDGDTDLAQSCALGGPLRLLRNDLAVGAGNWLRVRPRMLGDNSHAIGALVQADTASGSMLRLIQAGSSFLGQEPAEAHFGLGTATVVDQLTIRWPDGSVTVLNGVSAGQVVDVVHGGYGDLDGDGDVDDVDLAAFQGCLGSDVTASPGCRPADRDGDGHVGCLDWMHFVIAYEDSTGGLPSLPDDCNGNGLPDDCDLDLGFATDCDGNGSLDECDIALGVLEDLDGDGIPDVCVRFRRGDVDFDGAITIADAIAILIPPTGGPDCDDAQDANDDGQIDIADPITLLSYLFIGGSAPPAPALDCGLDPTPDLVVCVEPPDC